MFWHPAINVLSFVLIIALQLSLLLKDTFVGATIIEDKPVQPEKGLIPIFDTLLGMVTEVKPVQFWKAKSPMYVTLLGMVIEVKLVQPEKVKSGMPHRLIERVTEVKPLHP